MHPEDLPEESLQEVWSETALRHAQYPANLGEMTKYDGVALVKGPCGDRMAIWLKLDGEVIGKASFVTDGCGATLACGSAVTTLAQGLTPFDARRVTPQAVIGFLDGLPPSHLHCATLAVQTLARALEALEKKRDNPST